MRPLHASCAAALSIHSCFEHVLMLDSLLAAGPFYRRLSAADLSSSQEDMSDSKLARPMLVLKPNSAFDSLAYNFSLCRSVASIAMPMIQADRYSCSPTRLYGRLEATLPDLYLSWEDRRIAASEILGSAATLCCPSKHQQDKTGCYDDRVLSICRLWRTISAPMCQGTCDSV